VALPAIMLRQSVRDVIAEVLGSMRRNLEPLGSSTIVPSRYVVYLHPSEYARLEPAIPMLREQTIRALADELEKLNHPSRLRRYGDGVLGRPRPSFTGAERTWLVDAPPAANDDVEEGALLIDAQLRLPPVVTPEVDGHRCRV